MNHLKKWKHRKKFMIILGLELFVLLVSGAVYFSMRVGILLNTSYASEYNPIEKQETSHQMESVDTLLSETTSEETADSENKDAISLPKTVDTDPSSITVLVNHLYNVPADYVPEELVVPDVEFTFSHIEDKRKMRPEAAAALEELFADAKADDIQLSAVSGYRSYSRQYDIYLNNVRNRGEEYANRYSAPPGHSEHQTGLSIDVSCKANSYDLSYRLADLPEGIWLKCNSWRYGFIVRYPEDKESITGYYYEPWHIRYVGTELAAYLYEHDLTLDEYYGVSAEEYEWSFDFETARKLMGRTNETSYLPSSGSSQKKPSTPQKDDPQKDDPQKDDPQKDDPTPVSGSAVDADSHTTSETKSDP